MSATRPPTAAVADSAMSGPFLLLLLLCFLVPPAGCIPLLQHALVGLVGTSHLSFSTQSSF